MADTPKKRKRRGEREDGRILVTMVIGTTEDGKPKRKYFYGRTRQEAEAKREAYKRKKEGGLSEASDSLTVDGWVKEWLECYKDEAYIKENRSCINRLSSAIGFRLIKSIVEADLHAALSAVAGMSFATVKKYRAYIRQVFSAALRNRIIIHDPSVGLELPEYVRGSHRALERWEVEAILNHWSESRAGLWAMLMLLCGLRRGEMAALEWENVDMENRQIRICQAVAFPSNKAVLQDHTKTPAGMRTIPICAPLYAALETVPVEHRAGFVCLSSTGEQLSESAITRGWKAFNHTIERALNRDAENGDIHFHVRMHDLRHTFATALYDAGVSIKTAQYYLGHVDIKMTMDLYTHLSKEHEREDAGLLLDYFNKISDAKNELNSGSV